MKKMKNELQLLSVHARCVSLADGIIYLYLKIEAKLIGLVGGVEWGCDCAGVRHCQERHHKLDLRVLFEQESARRPQRENVNLNRITK